MGKEVQCKIIISEKIDLYNNISYNEILLVFIDEYQFLREKHIDKLIREINEDSDVYYYGLKIDFK